MAQEISGANRSHAALPVEPFQCLFHVENVTHFIQKPLVNGCELRNLIKGHVVFQSLRKGEETYFSANIL